MTDSDTWELHDDRPLASLCYGPQRVRMTVIGLGGGDLLVVSPGVPVSDAAWDRLAGWGRPRFLLAPNKFHNLGLRGWRERFPAARVVADPRALPRLRRKFPELEIDDLAPLVAALPAGVRLLSPASAKQGETWVSVETAAGAAWVVADAIVNETRLPGGALGLLMRALGFRAGLLTNPFFKRVFLGDRAAYRRWISAELARDRPVLLIPAHGAPLRDPDLASRLRAISDAA